MSGCVRAVAATCVAFLDPQAHADARLLAGIRLSLLYSLCALGTLTDTSGFNATQGVETPVRLRASMWPLEEQLNFHSKNSWIPSLLGKATKEWSWVLEIKNARSYASTPAYIFRAWLVIDCRTNLHLLFSSSRPISVIFQLSSYPLAYYWDGCYFLSSSILLGWMLLPIQWHITGTDVTS
jgi:hypothetical protein